jgi:hypothetical protein
VKQWSEPTLVKFLELPDALESGAVVYQLCSYLGAFPFSSNAPATLTGEALLRVVCLMTGRHMRVLPRGKEAWTKEIWKGCAVLDEEAAAPPTTTDDAEPPQTKDTGAAAEAPKPEAPPADESEGDKKPEKNIGEEEGELAYYALELINGVEVLKQDGGFNVEHAAIPSDNFRKLLQLLLLIAPLEPEQQVSSYGAQLDARRLEGLRAAANCILASFGHEEDSGIGYETFDIVVSNTLPHLFDKFVPLFENFLSPQAVQLRKRKDSASDAPPQSSQPVVTISEAATATHKPAPVPTLEPLLPVHGDILDLNLLSQLSFMFSDKNVFHRLQPLYLGHNHGYSMGSFEKSVFSWLGPSVILVSGTLLSQTTKQSHARTFLDDLPHRRLSSGVKPAQLPSLADKPAQDAQRIIYGAYVPVPWKATEKTTFGTDQTTLFQLSPFHDVFPASYHSQNYIYFNKPPSTYPGLGFGSPLPNYSSMTTSQQSVGNPTRRSSVTTYSASDLAYSSGSISAGSFSGPSSPGLARRSSLLSDDAIPLGPVSLHIDDALQFGVFTHLASGGGSFQPSKLPTSARTTLNGGWQDRFEIDAIEVWGVGDARI